MRKFVALVLIALLVSPISLAVAPRPAHALFGIGDIVLDPTNLIQNTISAVADPLTAAATTWTQIKGQVLDPLAHALAQAVLKEITASVVNSINGTNGSPQFVQSLSLNLQQVGDTVALAFVSHFGSSINSPFAPAIAGALQRNYLQQSSLAGFFAGNQCTLTSVSSNINSYLAGNWSQGGLGAWFALTGPNANNPLILYELGKGQLASVVGGAQTNQRQTIAQNNGFLSWCGSTDTANAGNEADQGTISTVTVTPQVAEAQTCTNSDGTPGFVQTPGSVIYSSLNKALGSGVDSLVNVQNFDQMVDTILSALITKVVSTGLSALSGSDSSGSFNGQPSGSTGSTNPNAASVSSQANSLAQTSLNQVAAYTTAWQTIQSAAQQASSVVTDLGSACSGLANQTQTALSTEIQPVLTRAQQAFSSASSTQALALRVQTEAGGYSAGTAGAGGALTSDTQALSAAPPTVSDVATAQSAAQTTGAATSTWAYTLTVSGGTLVDQMNLITKNAQAMKPFCGAPPPVLQ